MKTTLYFIALLLPPEISKHITSCKKEIAKKYGAYHALKSPPHITLQMPFRRGEEEEPVMKQKLNAFASVHSVLDIQLWGFGCFPPRVIYANITDPEPIINRFTALQKFLTDELNFGKKDLTHRFHPHITLATRDLRKEDFPDAWSDFMNRDYQVGFQSGGVTLLKHNGKFWNVFHTFHWGG